MADVRAQLDRFLRQTPRFGRGVYVATGAVVVGDVELGDASSVWYNAVLRGDINAIRVGPVSNIQDNAVLHLADEWPCVLGGWVTVGHGAIVHACTIEDEVLVGMGATILDGAVIGARSVVGAGTVVTKGMRVPPGSLVMGLPARVVRSLTAEEQRANRKLAEKYAANAAYCLEHSINLQGR